MSTDPATKKVAILGGGLAGIATAIHLTDPRNEQRCEVTIYQSGWRLGGKCASGRSVQHQLIEEHGLHILMGFYENTFRMVRRMMEEWSIPTGHPWHAESGASDRWLNAFSPANYAVLLRDGDRSQKPLHLSFPATTGLPGDGAPPPTSAQQLAKKLRSALRSLHDRLGNESRTPDDVLLEWFQCGSALTSAEPGATKRWMVYDFMECAWFGLKFWKRYRRRRNSASSPSDYEVFDSIIDVGLALVKGLLLNCRKIRSASLDALDDYDLREFLEKYGASPKSSRNPMIAALYDSVFATPGGVPGVEHENLAAGAAIRSFLNVVAGYKGAPWWRMKAGMGDTIFTPAYEVLRRRGVKFRFFHRVAQIVLSEDRRDVARVVIHRQAKTKNGAPYDPLIPVRVRKSHDDDCFFDDPLMCWPNEPRWEQLQNPDTLRGIDFERDTSFMVDACELIAGSREDSEHLSCFDEFVLAIPVSAFESIGIDNANSAIANLVRNLDTVRTCAYQVWLSKDLRALGWQGNDGPILGNFIDPLNTWADMSHLIAAEGRDNEFSPKNVSYFTGVIPESEAQPLQFAERAARYTFNRLVCEFLPKGVDEPDLRLGEYLRVNVGVSERYVLSSAGTTKFRLAADESGINNMKFAGDWTRNGLNVGAAEPTVMSAMQASHAISGWPSLSDIVRHNYKSTKQQRPRKS